jgi:hypothetical protein
LETNKLKLGIREGKREKNNKTNRTTFLKQKGNTLPDAIPLSLSFHIFLLLLAPSATLDSLQLLLHYFTHHPSK